MTCARVRILLSDYLDGELSARDTAEIRGHLQCCLGCEQEHQALRRTVHLVAIHGRQTAPIDCRDAVLARIRLESRTPAKVQTGFGRFAFPLLPSFSASPALARAVAAVALVAALAGARVAWMLRTAPDAPRPGQFATSPQPPREDYLKLHVPYQYGQAMGRDDQIILASDMVVSEP